MNISFSGSLHPTLHPPETPIRKQNAPPNRTIPTSSVILGIAPWPALAVVAREAGFVTSKSNLEVGRAEPPRRRKRVDLAILTRPTLLIDVTVRSPYAQGATPGTRDSSTGVFSFEHMHHVTRAQDQKRNKYLVAVANERKTFRSFVVSATGHFGSEASDICTLLAGGLVKRFFMAHSEAVKTAKRFIQTTMLSKMARQIVAGYTRTSLVYAGGAPLALSLNH